MTPHSSVLGFYSAGPRGLSWKTRLFLRLRWYLTPYLQMASHLPMRGKILDLGAGHGLLGFALARQSAHREVLGVDHDEDRVRIASQALQQAQNSGEALPLRFEKGTLLAPPAGPFEGISAIDVMHYFPPQEQRQIVQWIVKNLRDGGTVIVREVNPEGGIIARCNRLYEKLATFSGFTRSNRQTHLFFRTVRGWNQLLQEAGLEVTSQRCSSVLFADVLFIGKKGTVAP